MRIICILSFSFYDLNFIILVEFYLVYYLYNFCSGLVEVRPEDLNSSSRLFTLPQSRTYTLRDLQPKCPWVRCLQGEQQSLDQNTRQIHKGGSPWMCDQHNVKASAGDNSGQHTDKGHTPNPRTEFKIPDSAWNRTRAAWKAGILPTMPRRRIASTLPRK